MNCSRSSFRVTNTMLLRARATNSLSASYFTSFCCERHFMAEGFGVLKECHNGRTNVSDSLVVPIQGSDKDITWEFPSSSTATSPAPPQPSKREQYGLRQAATLMMMMMMNSAETARPHGAATTADGDLLCNNGASRASLSGKCVQRAQRAHGHGEPFPNIFLKRQCACAGGPASTGRDVATHRAGGTGPWSACGLSFSPKKQRTQAQHASGRTRGVHELSQAGRHYLTTS